MCHVDERVPDPLLKRLQLDLECAAELRVEGPERLVEQEHGGVQHEGVGERAPLLLATESSAGAPPLKTVELDQLDGVADPLG